GRVLQALVRILEQARQHGQIQFVHAQPQAMAFLGAVMGYPLPAVLLSDQWPTPEQLQHMTEAAITAFLLAWQYSPSAITE
ncbi:TetR/AcrR family transcriptional regulator C-terminal domain-containing protein, partial [Serratia sp. 22278]